MVDAPKKIEVGNPLVIMFQNASGSTETHIHPPFDWTHEHYGLLIADLVRHVAATYHVHENRVWEWVEKERRHPTNAPKTIQEAFPSVTKQ